MRTARRNVAFVNYNESDEDPAPGKRKASATPPREAKPVTRAEELLALPERPTRKSKLAESEFHQDDLRQCKLPRDPTRPSSFDADAWHARLRAYEDLAAELMRD